MTPRVINAAPSLEKAEIHGIDDQRPMSSKIMGMLGRIFIETIPQWLAVGVMLGLIFGGCCSNVFALEAIIKSVHSLLALCLQLVITWMLTKLCSLGSSPPAVPF